MPKEFYAPYNFVSTKDLPDSNKTDWAPNEAHPNAPQARHDKWVNNTKSGRILCCLETKTPMVIGAEQKQDSESDAGVVNQYRLNGEVAAPANSLRGIIGAGMECLSQSSMRVLDDKQLSVRSPMSESNLDFGVLLIGESKGKKLIVVKPLTISPIKKVNNEFKLSEAQKEVFTGLKWRDILPVYLDYIHRGKPQRNSFLDNDDLKTTNLMEPVFYWAKLLGPNEDISYSINDSAGLKTKGPFLIGQRIDGEPLTKEEYSTKFNHEPLAVNNNGYIRGVLFILGTKGREGEIPNNKKHEYFIPYPESTAKYLTAPETIISNFNALAKDAVERSDQPSVKVNLPFIPQGYQSHKLMHRSIVRFSADYETKKVTNISWSAIWRKLVDGTQRSFFSAVSKDLLPWNPERSKLTPAELLLGVVEDYKDLDDKAHPARNLSSRIHFSDAIGASEILLMEETFLKILASPKLPSPNMYFKPKNSRQNNFIAKTELSIAQHVPRGRKVYLHHPQEQAKLAKYWETNNTENLNQKLKVRPIPTGTKLYFHIDFENLTDEELSLALSAIKPSPEFCHRLGLGKPLGLGSVKIDPLATLLIDRKNRYKNMLNLNHDEGRYHTYIKGTLTSEALSQITVPERYQEDFQAIQALTPIEWTAKKDLIDGGSLEALQTIGNPDNLTTGLEVKYPVAAGQTPETEGYEWFVNNDHRDGNKQSLGTIEGNKTIPTLEENSPPPRNNGYNNTGRR